MVVFILKGGRYFWEFGLVYMLWTTVVVILNRRLRADSTLHVVLHRFRSGCSTGITYLDYNLLQNLMDTKEEVIYTILLDQYKAHHALNRDRCLKIIEGYGVLLWSLHLIQIY